MPVGRRSWQPKAMRERIAEYVRENARGVTPQYIAARVLGESASPGGSTHYEALRAEQRPDGGYGRFHTMDTKDKSKRLFPTTEAAVYRMRDLMLPADDPVVARAGGALLGYADGSLAYSDTIERHFGFKTAISSMAAANAAALGIRDPRVEERKRLCARAAGEAAVEIEERGAIDLAAWQARSRARGDFMLLPETVHMLWLLTDNAYADEWAAHVFLSYLWSLEKGVYYIPGIPAARFQSVTSNRFSRWLFVLEQFAGTSAFPALMGCGAYEFLEGEALGLISGEFVPRASADLPGRYWEGRRDGSALAWELAARAARLLLCAEREC